MRLKKFRVKKYRSIRDSDWCEVEHTKTILVGPNEAGKSALLKALQQLSPPQGVKPFDPLRDYPRSEYNDITAGRVNPDDVDVVTAHFRLEQADLEIIPDGFADVSFVATRFLTGRLECSLEGGPAPVRYRDVTKDLSRLAANLTESETHSTQLQAITGDLHGDDVLSPDKADELRNWLHDVTPNVDEDNEREEKRLDNLNLIMERVNSAKQVTELLKERLPVFVLFSNYHRVRPRIHLTRLAARERRQDYEDEWFDYGNACLLSFLGFKASELSRLGALNVPKGHEREAIDIYQDKLDSRDYQLNAASVKLTEEIASAWNPDLEKGEAARLEVKADAQYLKVVVVDDLGVQVELDQRSEGFQWLVSFFIVFFAEAQDKHARAILLLDEPGMSLHALKQREFRRTLDRLADQNQLLFTTHSPFLVGPNELDRVRVVEMENRQKGTVVHTTLTAGDSAALIPLQEALGFDMAQSLFGQSRNLICEGLTDYWYVEATAALLRESDEESLDEGIALIPAHGAGKVTYFATIMHANKLRVAALLDSDASGDHAAAQDTLRHTLKRRGILRTKDFYTGLVKTPEIEDMLRATLLRVVREEKVDLEEIANTQKSRPIVDLMQEHVPNFSKYKLAKSYLRWTRNHSYADLTSQEKSEWKALLRAINVALPAE